MMASLFAVSYSLALGRPTPNHIPAAVVGNPLSHPAVVRAIETATDGGLDLHPYASTSEAEHEIAEQQIYAAVVLVGPRPRLLIASAASTSVARLLQQAATRIPPSAGPLRVVDLYPLPTSDPEGLVSFYITIAATILGFVTMFQLRANAPGLSFRAWLNCIAALAVCGGLALALISDPILKALHGPFLELWAALGAEIAAARSGTRRPVAPSRRRCCRPSTASSVASSPTEPQWRRSAMQCTSATTSTLSRSSSRRGGSCARWRRCYLRGLGDASRQPSSRSSIAVLLLVDALFSLRSRRLRWLRRSVGHAWGRGLHGGRVDRAGATLREALLDCGAEAAGAQ